jgi:hypothetical protein
VPIKAQKRLAMGMIDALLDQSHTASKQPEKTFQTVKTINFPTR